MTFLSILSFVCTDLAIPTKKVDIRRLYLQSLNLRYKNVTSLSQIDFLEGYRTHRRDWWQIIDLIAIFLFRFLLFGVFFLQHSATTAYNTLPLLLLGNKVV